MMKISTNVKDELFNEVEDDEMTLEKITELSSHLKPEFDDVHKNPDYGKSFEQLIIENENFAYSVVHKEFSKYSEEIKEELYSAAKLGLVYAASKYNPKQEKAKFISYAVNWIRYYIHEEIRKLNPIKLNQNFITKRNKVKKVVKDFMTKYNRKPSLKEISELTGMSIKVIGNIYGVNNCEDFSYISFQSVMSNNSSRNEDSGTMIENRLTNEYLDNAIDNSGMVEFEMKDLFEALKKRVSEQDYNMYLDLVLNGMSYSDIAKKYGLKFASSASYKLKCIQKICRKLTA